MKTSIPPLRFVLLLLVPLVLMFHGAAVSMPAERSNEAGQHNNVQDKKVDEGLALKLWLHRPEMAPAMTPATATPCGVQ